VILQRNPIAMLRCTHARNRRALGLALKQTNAPALFNWMARLREDSPTVDAPNRVGEWGDTHVMRIEHEPLRRASPVFKLSFERHVAKSNVAKSSQVTPRCGQVRLVTG